MVEGSLKGGDELAVFIMGKLMGNIVMCVKWWL